MKNLKLGMLKKKRKEKKNQSIILNSMRLGGVLSLLPTLRIVYQVVEINNHCDYCVSVWLLRACVCVCVVKAQQFIFEFITYLNINFSLFRFFFSVYFKPFSMRSRRRWRRWRLWDFHLSVEEEKKKETRKRRRRRRAVSGSMSGRKNIFGNVHLLFSFYHS